MMKRSGLVRARGLAFALAMALSPMAAQAWASEAAVPHGRAEIPRAAEAMTPTPKKRVWWWSDSLFMAPPVHARMSAITGDPKYLRAMDAQWWRTYARLRDPKEHIFYRDDPEVDDPDYRSPVSRP
jgi:rhamnogalacturonyl hydrolase YesR